MSKKKTYQSAADQADNYVSSTSGYDTGGLLLNPDRKSRNSAAGQSAAGTTGAKAPAPSSSKGSGKPSLFSRIVSFISKGLYVIGFLLLAVFCTLIYGPVFHHIALDNFVCSDAEAMAYVHRLPYGTLFVAARYILLVFKSQWIGGLLMAALLTCTAWLFDRLFLLFTARSKRLAGLGLGFGFLPVIGMLYYMVHRGYDLFLRCEISTFVIWTVGLFAVALVVGLVACVIKRFMLKGNAMRTGIFTFVGFLVSFCAYSFLMKQAIVEGENVRVSCHMQNILDETEDWEAMADLARSCKQPTRSVAALYTIALVHQNELLEHVFDIPFDYAELELDNVGGDDEGINYIADCNLHAGLATGAYHSSMEYNVMTGPHLRNYKRMAVCAILNGELPLAKRLLRLIGKVPFEQAWVEKYEAMVNDPKLIDEDETLATIRSLAPLEKGFEQKFRQPLFLGYNVGVNNGSNATLVTSVATCMYSKDLDNFLVRADFLQKVMPLPLPVMQGILIASLRRPGLLEKFPQVNSQSSMLMPDLQDFIADAKPYLEKKKSAKSEEETKALQSEMADGLRDKWLGTYYYYYYCGNLNQTVKKTEGHGVN